MILVNNNIARRIVQAIGIPLPEGGLRYNEISNKIIVWSVDDGYGVWVVWVFSQR